MSSKPIAALCLALALAAAAAAQTKISGTTVCKPDKQQSMDVGDRANHAFAISQSKCTWTKPMEIAGTQSKEDTITAFDEISGDKSRGRGIVTLTMASGDKAFVSFQGSGTVKNGAPDTAEGKWHFTRGEGKLKGLKGAGTYKGKGGADGITYEVEGEYTLPK